MGGPLTPQPPHWVSVSVLSSGRVSACMPHGHMATIGRVPLGLLLPAEALLSNKTNRLLTGSLAMPAEGQERFGFLPISEAAA